MSAALHDIRAAIEREAPLYRAAGPDDGEAWREPDMSIVAAHRAAPPALPLEVFGTGWSAWIAAAAEGKGGPVDYVATALLSSTSAILANHRKASPWDGWTEPAIIWTGNVGLPSANKTPTLSAVLAPMHQLEEELDGDYARRLQEWRTRKAEAELIEAQWQADCKIAHREDRPLPTYPLGAEVPDAPQPRRLLVNDTTVEKLIRLSAGNERGLTYVRDELAGWIGAMDKYGGTGSDRALWLEAWNGQPYRLDRVKDGDKPIKTPALAVSLAGGIQPDRLASMILGGDDDGLAARLLLVWPERRKPTRPKASGDGGSAVRWLRRLASLELREAPLPFAPAAAVTFQAWREAVAEMEDGTAGLFLSWLGKLPGYVVRLALILEHLWWSAGDVDRPPAEISREAVERAVRLVRGYFVPMARRCLGDAALPEAERDATLLAHWICANSSLPALVNQRQLRRERILSTSKADRYRAALVELAEAGWVRPAPSREGDRPGRKRSDWQVNPALLSRSEARQ